MGKIYIRDKAFVRGLNENMLVIANQSFNAMFFIKQLWEEAKGEITIKGFVHEGMFPDHECCSLPIGHPNFKIFPLNQNLFDAVVGDYELDFVSEWLSTYGTDKRFQEFKNNENFAKPIFTIKKAQSLTKDFTAYLKDISKQNNVPYHSIVDLTQIITSFSKDSKKKYLAYEKIFAPDLTILVPARLSKNEQTDLILKISKQIFDLITESFWVLLIIDWIEFLKFISFLSKKNTLDEVKEYLKERTIYTSIKEIISDAKNFEEIDKIVGGQYQAALLLGPLMEKFMMVKFDNIAKKYINYSMVKNPRQRLLSEIEDHDANKDHDAKKLDEQVMQKSKKKKSNYVSGDAPTLSDDFVLSIFKKMNVGLLMTYELKGEPTNLLRYLKTIFYNTAKTELRKRTEQEYAKLYSVLKVSEKTLKQYEKEIIKGEIDIGMDVPADFTIFDLTSEEIRNIVEKKENKQQHVKDGYLSQNKIIASLLSEKILKRYQCDYNTSLLSNYKFGRSTLKKAIKELKNENRIPYSKEKSAHQYKIDDLSTIIEELFHYFKAKRNE